MVLVITTAVKTSNPTTEYFIKKKKLRGFGLLANYAERATAACWREVSANFCGQRVLRGHRNKSPWSLVSVFLTEAATISSK
jgi:hypothetical protein